MTEGHALFLEGRRNLTFPRVQQSFAPTLRYMIKRIVKELKKLKCKGKSLDKLLKCLE